MAKQIGYNFRFRPFRGAGAWVYEGGKGGARVAWCDSRALVPLGGSRRPVCIEPSEAVFKHPFSPVIPGNDIRLGS